MAGNIDEYDPETQTVDAIRDDLSNYPPGHPVVVQDAQGNRYQVGMIHMANQGGESEVVIRIKRTPER